MLNPFYSGLVCLSSASGRFRSMSHSRRLCRARDYLAARFNERTSLAEAAAQAELSPFYFHRLFADAFNETPHQFVTRLRIDHAKKLLLAGNHSVTDVCFDAGYESLGSFSTRFHSLTGLSPAEFRRESRRVFGTSGRHWPLYYMPACFQHFFAGY
jgi:AraC-like DNA-binding protein